MTNSNYIKNTFKQLPLGLKSMTPSVDRAHYEIALTEPHPKLTDYVKRNLRTYQKYMLHTPIDFETKISFSRAKEFVRKHYASRGGGEEQRVIFDSGCGRGMSSIVLGKLYPELPVIGVDRSVERLLTNQLYNSVPKKNPCQELEGKYANEEEIDDADTAIEAEELLPTNVILLKGELGTFWRLAMQSDWIVDKHFLLYPNPYGTNGDVKHRFQGIIIIQLTNKLLFDISLLY
jgi:tRNA (guanine-N7-)-methyltransferase